jgi:hypothetical protein
VARLLPNYPDIKVEIIVDYGLTDIVAERHREFFVQSSKIASWPPSTPSTGSPSSTLGGTNSMRRFEFRRTGFPRDESWLRSFRRFFLARGDATELSAASRTHSRENNRFGQKCRRLV